MTRVSRSDSLGSAVARSPSHSATVSRTGQVVASSTSARQRTRAQTAAFLLGIHPNISNVNDENCNRINTVQHFSEGLGITNHSKVGTAEKVIGQPFQAPELEKVEFRVPLHTLDEIQAITYVDRLHSESDSQQDIFDSIKATMDVPELYEHLGWRLSTARRMDPPHRLLTVHDITSAFKAVREEDSSSRRRTKKAVIEIINTAPALKEQPIQRKAAAMSSVEVMSPIQIHDHFRLSSAANDTMMISDKTLSRQQGHPALPPPLKRTYALYMESDDESSDNEPPQDIEDVLTSAHSRYPSMNFRQYIGKLKDHGVLYLPIAAHFATEFYEEQIGMSAGAAYTFQSCVSKAYVKAECAKGRRKKKARTHPA